MSTKNCQTMVVDDDPIYTMLMKKMLESNSFGSSLNDFSNGQTALEFLRENYQTDTIFIIFLDINMPVLDGWEFLDKIADFTTPENTLVLMVSSSIDQSDMDRANSNCYVIKYLAKPVLSSTLVELKAQIESRVAS